MTAHPDRTVLRGGTVVDGTGGDAREADVEILGDRIGVIGDIPAREGDDVVDCRGRLVMPGFIDAHAHADGTVFRPDVQLALLRQGITTVIGGQDGVSYAPGDGVWASRYFAAINGPHPTYTGGGVAELLRTYDGTTPLNVGYLVPAGTVRHAVMGMARGPADAGQLAHMQRLVADGLGSGALGLSTGLDYVPGIFAGTDELAQLCAPLAAAGGLYVTHMRGGYETNTAAGLEEVVAICAPGAAHDGVRGHVSHLHVDADDAERLLAGAAASGADLSFDMYPYTRGCTLVSMAVLPPQYSALAVDDAIARLSDPAERARLLDEWFPTVAHKPSLGPDWPSMIRVGHTPATDWAWAPGRTLAEIADRRQTSVEEATLDLLVAGRMEVNAVMAVRDERAIENLAQLFAHPGHTGGSDGIFIGAVPHPRAWGAFGRFLGTYVGRSFTWDGAAVHLAAHTAERFGLVDRGILRPGAVADIAIVDPATVADAATYDDPQRLARGIDDVFVNGTHALRDGELTGALAGRGLRRSPSPSKGTT
ncbi:MULTISPECIES: N-acyl-D-amino-acid deacylase family protein [Microbacterium]|uniref:D-aminoacylase n=1 Tax=Microbacterium trichothecenolyticum TaxID=69370 RepID=A0A0M2HGK0_MICTR|nr:MULTISPECIES: amidohydrolase family protein [Microbacterium]KJL43434.1 D-aminoacylase [Microbacterium trichothecenolyticum]MDR7189638.1 N-acyl-D-amino-acid deacylase [Microbacterium sp. BE35]